MKLTVLLVSVFLVFLYLSCTKTNGSFPPPPPPDPCSLISVALNGAVANPSASGAADGNITITATGGTGFSFNINGGAFQSVNKFSNLAAGNYTVIAKNSDGCSNSLVLRLTDPVVSCTGVNIVVNAIITDNVPCEPDNGTITITASGGVAPYQYALNGSAFQAPGYFSHVPTGSSIILVKDVNGCMGTASITINNAGSGPLFSTVKTLIHNKCLYCHGGTTPSGGISYATDCSIVTGQLRIKARAVDGIPSPMPVSGLLPAADRQKIMDWINAGGRYSD